PSFGRVPRLVATDAGFYSARNEAAAKAMGVKRVCIPNRSSKSPERKREQKKRWFRNGQKWPTGSEGRISVVKRRNGLDRCRYKGAERDHERFNCEPLASSAHSRRQWSQQVQRLSALPGQATPARLDCRSCSADNEVLAPNFFSSRARGRGAPRCFVERSLERFYVRQRDGDEPRVVRRCRFLRRSQDSFHPDPSCLGAQT